MTLGKGNRRSVCYQWLAATNYIEYNTTLPRSLSRKFYPGCICNAGSSHNVCKQGIGISFSIFRCACWGSPKPRTVRFASRRTRLTAWLCRSLRSLFPAHPRKEERGVFHAVARISGGYYANKVSVHLRTFPVYTGFYFTRDFTNSQARCQRI